jgi:hypothetical protein
LPSNSLYIFEDTQELDTEMTTVKIKSFFSIVYNF